MMWMGRKAFFFCVLRWSDEILSILVVVVCAVWCSWTEAIFIGTGFIDNNLLLHYCELSKRFWLGKSRQQLHIIKLLPFSFFSAHIHFWALTLTCVLFCFCLFHSLSGANLIWNWISLFRMPKISNTCWSCWITVRRIYRYVHFNSIIWRRSRRFCWCCCVSFWKEHRCYDVSEINHPITEHGIIGTREQKHLIQPNRNKFHQI